MTFDEFIGQEPIKQELKNIAARLDMHVLLRGPSGCGKTTLAELTAG
ncbi:MAG TPA: ATP-binding protein, partial [Candidatus Paceibacterota bacterium]